MERMEAARREKEDGFIRALELLCLSSIQIENVLDFGCGLGITVQLLRDKLGLNAIGVDLSADFVETEYLHRCDLTDLLRKYPEGFFDAIYSIEVFEHLEHPGQILSMLGTLLKPGGKILINTGTREYLNKYDQELHYIDPLRRGHISIYSLKSLQVLAASIGREADFLGDRKYEVILAPATGPAEPHPENLERIRRLGEYFPVLFREYMRLVLVEKEFELRTIWALQLQKMVEAQSQGTRQSAAQKPLWRKLWTQVAGRQGGSANK
jgi:SAM-dependent methyltransferase